ncbi:N-acetylneuraminate synthase [Azospirillum halopraeferens]|uniref:N-acetylneuraminate synthase n=1 Tax=Azospirillum halopraeferens TaxID=34010 RepID=UPI00041658DE|nr:N-acetylneuraminate synthase [Azospirillum halopraeferens]
MSVVVIAEAGVNHNGSPARALALVEAAADAGADAVKFQTFRAAKLARRGAPKAGYQTANGAAGDDQLAMLTALELDAAAHHAVARHCTALGITFLSSPFDEDSLRFLVEDLGVDRLKFGSGELTNGPLLLAAARTGRPMILSTGMATLGEVEDALALLAFGYAAPAGAGPGRAAFAEAWNDPAARGLLADRVTLLHCTTEYPSPPDDANLRAMDTLRTAFGLPVGFSDHTEGTVVAAAAVARGAVMVEKHFTLDRTLPGPDHKASLEPPELAALVSAIRTVERALGDGIKTPRPSERANIPVARKSLVAARPIAAGEILTGDALTAKRPGTGRSPMDLWDALGRPAARDYATDDPLE